MPYVPNYACGDFCDWLLNLSWQRLTGTQTALITTVYNASQAQTTITDQEWKDFNMVTSWRYQYYLNWISNYTPYSAEAEWYFKCMRVAPSLSFKSAVDTFITDLQGYGIWSQLDVLYLLANETEQGACINMVNPTEFTLIPVNSPTWSPLLGYTGNGSNAYLDTTFIPAYHGVNYTLNSACIGAYNRTSGNHAGQIFGVNQGGKAILYPQFTDGKTYFSANATTEANFTSADRVSALSVVRPNSANIAFYNRGLSQNSQAIASVSLASGRVFILANNQNGTPNNFTNKNISMFWMGSGAINQANFYTAVQALASSLGFNV